MLSARLRWKLKSHRERALERWRFPKVDMSLLRLADRCDHLEERWRFLSANIYGEDWQRYLRFHLRFRHEQRMEKLMYGTEL